MRPGVELLIDPPYIARAAAWMFSLACARPDAQVTASYRGDRRLLVMYGVGLPSRTRARRAHLAAGGTVAMWDLGYWNRNRSMRVAINSLHPTAKQIEDCSARRPRAHPDLNPESCADTDGPILLCGLGPKSCVHLGLKPYAWERAKVADLRERYPGRPILWRAKPGTPFERLSGTVPAPLGPIEHAIRGVSLVVCRHSNVAIDACIAGVPVECEDGAAFALYRNNPEPSVAARQAFLAKLSWWNWDQDESAEAWQFMDKATA